MKSALIAGAGMALPVRLGSTLVAPASVAAAPLAPTTLTKFTEQLPVPPVIDARGGGAYTLPMAEGRHQFHAMLPATPTWGYGGGAYLGPTFEARRGVPVTVNAVNNLGAHPLAYAVDTGLHGAVEADKTTPRATVHLHGGNTEARSEGHPELTFLPGQTYRYNYHNDQEAATLWYHDHSMGVTRLNVYAGLAGFYLLRDAGDTGLPGNPLGLPTAPYEIPLVIQDKMFNADGTLAFPPGPLRIWAPEFFGDVATVNGKAWPNLNVDRGIYRFRLLNGSNARFYNLSLSNNQAIYQIGSDGGLLNAPVAAKEIMIAPGERADVLIDFSRLAPGTTLVLGNNAGSPYPATNNHNSPKRGALPEILQFTVGSRPGFQGRLPAALRATPIQRLPAPSRVRNLAVVEILDPATGEPLYALLNNLTWMDAMAGKMEMPRVNTVEQWNIINTTGDAHPIHLHLIQFQLLQRQKFNVAAYMGAYYPQLPGPGGGGIGPWPVPSADAFLQMQPSGPTPNEMGWKGHHAGLSGRGNTSRGPLRGGGARGALRPVVHRELRVALPHSGPRGQRDDAALHGDAVRRPSNQAKGARRPRLVGGAALPLRVYSGRMSETARLRSGKALGPTRSPRRRTRALR